ncbi:MAG: hypothetical protein K6A23_03685 [Butyrivibrio sp.]|nr:hypothetical protein [Butyrivibrio sp.]
MQQFIDFNSAVYNFKDNERVTALTKALKITTSTFNIRAFTWNEFYIYVHILRCNIKNNSYEWYPELRKLILAIENKDIDITQKRILLPILFLSVPNKIAKLQGINYLKDILMELNSTELKYYINVQSAVKLYVYYYIKNCYPYIYSSKELIDIVACLNAAKMSLTKDNWKFFEEVFGNYEIIINETNLNDF